MKRFDVRLLAFVMVLMVASLGMLGAQAAFEAQGPQTVTIIGTTDIHGNVWGFSYENNKDTTNTGMARIATYLEQVRQETPNVVLVDNGDTIQGNILTDDLYNKRPGEHPVNELLFNIFL